MKTGSISPFYGVVSALDPRNIPGTAAQDMLNVRCVDGRIALRYGFKNLLSPQANFSAFHGADYVQGYNGTTLKEEYITFETLSGTTKPYRIAVNSSTGALSAQVVITNGVTALTLSGTDWLSRAYQSYCYCINPNETTSVYRHEIGTDNSFTPLAQAAAPTVPLSYVVSYGGTSTAYSVRSWAAVLTGNVTYTGQGTASGFAANSDGSLTLGTTSAGAGSFTLDMKAGTGINADQDWTYNDSFFFTVQGEPGAGNGSYSFDTTKFKPSFINDDGSPVTFIPFEVTARLISPQVGLTPAVYGIRFEFDKTDLRASWDNIRKFVCEFWVTGNSGAKFRMSSMTLGGVWMSESRNPILPRDLLLTYSYYNSTGLFESGLCTIARQIPFAVLAGQSPAANFLGLGVHLTLTTTTSGDGSVDNNRIYGYDTKNDLYRLVTTFSDAGTTYAYKTSYNELHALTAYNNITPFKTDKCVNAFPFKGWIIWLYQGGYQNVRHSRIGDAEKQQSDLDLDEDLTRGETFTLSDNLADEPLGGCQAGDTAFIVGSQGVYAQEGDAPPLMSPCKKLAGSFGCAGKFAYCRWKDDSGNPGIAWVSRDGQVYFAPADPQFVGDDGGKPQLISSAIQTGDLSLGAFLRDAQGISDLSGVRLGVDEGTDTLYVVLGNRFLRFVRNAAGDRHWEPGRHGITGTWSYLAFSSRWRMKVARSSGQFDEWEWNTAAGAYIQGALRDGGAAVPTPFWKSKLLRTSQNRRTLALRLVRNSLNDEVSVMVYSERTPEGNLYQFEAGKQRVRTGIANMGREMAYKITLPDSDCTVSVLETEDTLMDRRQSY